MFILAALCLLAGILPGLVIDALAPVTIEILGSRMPVQAGQPWLSIVPIAESRSSYNGLLVMVFITMSASLGGLRHPSLRLARAAAGAGLGLRLLRCNARRAVFGRQLCPADPPRVRHAAVPRPRPCRDAATRRHPAGAAADRTARPGLGTGSMRRSRAPSAFRPTRLNRLQFLTIRQYLSLVFATLVTLLLVLAIWS